MLPRNKEDAHVLNTSTTKLRHYKKEEAEWPAVLSVVVLYRTWKSQAGRPSFHWTTHDQPVAFDAVCALPMMPIGIGMHINSAIGPGASPRRVVNEQHVSAPVKAAHSPTPRTESRCNDGTETKTDSSAHHNSRPRWTGANGNLPRGPHQESKMTGGAPSIRVRHRRAGSWE